MSTRSGKRIHTSPEELTTRNVIKSDRKTRSQKHNENSGIEEIPKKKHYVLRQPSDDDPSIDITNQGKGNSRRTTLKKNNEIENLKMDPVETTSTRTSRRKKKHVEEISQSLLKPRHSKKNRHTYASLLKSPVGDFNIGGKKVIKKKTSSGSVVVEDLNDCPPTSVNNSMSSNENKNYSMDSFHSAAGSIDGSPKPTMSITNVLDLDTNKNNKKSKKKAPKTLNSSYENMDVTKCGKNVLKKKSKRMVKNADSPVNHCQNNEKIEDVKPAMHRGNESDIHNTTQESIHAEGSVCDTNNKGKTSLHIIDVNESQAINTFLKDSDNINDMTDVNKVSQHDKKPKKEKKSKRKQSKCNLSANSNNDVSLNKIFAESDENMPAIDNLRKSTLDAENLNASGKNKKSNEQEIVNTTFDIEKPDCEAKDYEKDNSKNVAQELNSTFEICYGENNKVNLTPHEQDKNLTNNSEEETEVINNCKKNTSVARNENLDATYEKVKLNVTNDESANAIKTSIISSDSSNITEDKSLSRISITSDDSRNDNIINTTPVLIESSLDDSQITLKCQKSSNNLNTSEKSSPRNQELIEDVPKTPPMERQGTFTKDSPTTTPNKQRMSPGCTPFPSGKRSSSKKPLNVTHSLEKSRRSSLIENPRTTRVMFCSPINTPIIVEQKKGKLIKSSLKGSNKSFVFSENVPHLVGSGRKRSYTHSEVEDINVKRKRLLSDQKSFSDKLSRTRTSSASGAITPSKETPGTKDARVTRKKLPNFAALHQKQFEKMESLDECQERKAKRAKQMLSAIPITSSKDKDSSADVSKVKSQSSKKQHTLESIIPSYTRFGFKMKNDPNLTLTKRNDATMSSNTTTNEALNTTDIFKNLNKSNPFANVPKTSVKSKENIPIALKRQATLPSLTGCTNRKDVAKQTIMREKSFTDKRSMVRNENRTIIKGVRTNRRFELQMQMRNIS